MKRKTYGRQPDVGPLDVEEGSPGDVGDRGPNLLPGVDNVDPEGVNGIPADVITVHPGDENLPLVVVDKESSYHLETTFKPS